MTDPAEQLAQDRFRRRFGSAPRWLSSAPGRVNLIGEFPDFNDGFVLPMAIEQRTAVAAAPNNSDQIVLHSQEANDTVVIDLKQALVPDAKGRWSNYPKGVIAEFVGLKLQIPGLSAVIASTLPMGAGLSSSAALESAIALLIQHVCEIHLERELIAHLCRHAEHTYAQVPCGLMDQYICLMGRPDHVLLLDCQSNVPTWIAWTDPDIAVLVVNTRVKHELSSSAYSSRRESCLAAARTMGAASLRAVDYGELIARASDMDEMSLRCGRHVVTENHRTRQAADRIRQRDWAGLGALMYESHDSLRDDYQVSCEELNLVVDFARALGPTEGVLGARMTGGGFGGCAIVLARAASQERICELITQHYRAQIGISPSIFVCRPSRGASVQEVNHGA
jgi:galactokinase